MTKFALTHRTFVMTLAVLAMLSGVLTFLSISRREDPKMETRVALVVCQWPGAPALKVDELVVDVLDDAIQRVEGVHEIRSTSYVGGALIQVELDKYVTEFAQSWDELRHEVRAVEGQLPPGAFTPVVNANFGDVSSLCLTMFQIPIGGSTIERPYTDRDLQDAAEIVENELEALASVSAVTI